MDMNAALDAHVQSVVAIHFDERSGAPYWLERQRAMGFNAVKELQSFGDLARLGAMDEGALSRRPILDFVPVSQRPRLHGAILTETGGTTGRPKRTIFQAEEFRAAFVQPFVVMAERAGFPRGGSWLYVGPSGPHVIGQAAAECAVAMGSHQPFTVDFDPRWFRKLPPGSVGRERYTRHLVDQAIDVVASEPVDVLFTTPPMVRNLAAAMSDVDRDRIRGVHYGGMRVEPTVLVAAQTQWFPRAVHLAGYGNSLFGVCMEEGGLPDRRLQYFPHGLRLQVRVDENEHVWMHRLDPTVLIANLAERDAATAADPSAELQHLGYGAGVEDPRPPRQIPGVDQTGIY